MNTLKIFLLILLSNSLLSQSVPIWDIGTIWTYEVYHRGGGVSFVKNEIVDTVNIDNLKLYQVETSPLNTKIEYFYYSGQKVYSYIVEDKYLQLLYDFENTNDYGTNYQPICSVYFDYDSMVYKTYTVNIDSTTIFDMPDGSFRTLEYASITDTTIMHLDTIIQLEAERTILNGIGFFKAGQAHTHDWEFGRHFCDVWDYTLTGLRCFETNSEFYNFKSYPCDSIWFQTNTEELIAKKQPNLYPNPSNGLINLNIEGHDLKYRVLDSDGQVLNCGITINNQIQLIYDGINIVQLYYNNDWITYRILNNSR